MINKLEACCLVLVLIQRRKEALLVLHRKPHNGARLEGSVNPALCGSEVRGTVRYSGCAAVLYLYPYLHGHCKYNTISYIAGTVGGATCTCTVLCGWYGYGGRYCIQNLVFGRTNGLGP
jgi:hypothetical protein